MEWSLNAVWMERWILETTGFKEMLLKAKVLALRRVSIYIHLGIASSILSVSFNQKISGGGWISFVSRTEVHKSHFMFRELSAEMDIQYESGKIWLTLDI